MRKIVQISEYFDREDEDVSYSVWMLDSSFLITSKHGPIKEFATLEEAENFAEDLVTS